MSLIKISTLRTTFKTQYSLLRTLWSFRNKLSPKARTGLRNYWDKIQFRVTRASKWNSPSLSCSFFKTGTVNFLHTKNSKTNVCLEAMLQNSAMLYLYQTTIYKTVWHIWKTASVEPDNSTWTGEQHRLQVPQLEFFIGPGVAFRVLTFVMMEH